MVPTSASRGGREMRKVAIVAALLAFASGCKSDEEKLADAMQGLAKKLEEGGGMQRARGREPGEPVRQVQLPLRERPAHGMLRKSQIVDDEPGAPREGEGEVRPVAERRVCDRDRGGLHEARRRPQGVAPRRRPRAA